MFSSTLEVNFDGKAAEPRKPFSYSFIFRSIEDFPVSVVLIEAETYFSHLDFSVECLLKACLFSWTPQINFEWKAGRDVFVGTCFSFDGRLFGRLLED